VVRHLPRVLADQVGSISLTAVATVSARPSTTGSPRPTMPALVWTFRNSQRGWTRNVSSLVTLSGSRALTGASFSWPAATAARPAAAAAAAPAAITSRRFMVVFPPKKYDWPSYYPGVREG
jgi:hypothetical protein